MPDCEMENKDIAALLKRRRWAINPELYRQKQQDYRKKIKSNLPHCDECDMCVLVGKEKQDGYRRLCIDKMRLIEQKVSNSPQWCKKRINNSGKVKAYDEHIDRTKDNENKTI